MRAIVWAILVVGAVALLWGEPQYMVGNGECAIPNAYTPCRAYLECDYKGILTGLHRYIPDTGEDCPLFRVRPFHQHYPEIEYGYGLHKFR